MNMIGEKNETEFDIFIIAHIQEMEKNFPQMDQILNNFFLDYFGTKQPKRKIYLIFLLFTEGNVSTKTYCKLQQKPGRYYLPVYYSQERGGVYISKQDSGFGLRQYRKMYDELMEMLLKANENSRHYYE